MGTFCSHGDERICFIDGQRCLKNKIRGCGFLAHRDSCIHFDAKLFAAIHGC